MKTSIPFIFFTLFAISLGSCSSDDDAPVTGPGEIPEEIPTAEYRLTFTPSFTEETHPEDYPDDPAFGTIVAIAHPPEITVFQVGQLASEGLKAYAETGDVDALAIEISNSGEEGEDIVATIVTNGTVTPDESTVTTINVTPTNTRITFLARINPSPDWFLGVNAFNVVDGNTLIDQEEITLFPIDAGTDAGTTYTSEDEANSEAISIINGPPFADGTFVPALGSLVIQRNN